jgi:predicted alpha/beta hydrolase
VRPRTPTRLHIPATDGFALAATLFRSARPAPRGTLIFAGGLGNPRYNYAAYAGYMAGQGWDVLTFDYRGIGDSAAPGETAAAFSLVDWGEKDLTGVIDWARQRLASERVALLCHSIGGQVAGLALNNDRLSALVAVATPRSNWGHWTGWRKLGAYLYFRCYVPLCVKVRGRLVTGRPGLDPLPRGVARDLVGLGVNRHHRDAAGADLRHRFANVSAPALAISFSDDRLLAPERTVDVLYNEYFTRAPLTRWHFRPEDVGVRALGHSGYFDPGVCPEGLWQATSRWLADACGGMPARAALPDGRPEPQPLFNARAPHTPEGAPPEPRARLAAADRPGPACHVRRQRANFGAGGRQPQRWQRSRA